MRAQPEKNTFIDDILYEVLVEWKGLNLGHKFVYIETNIDDLRYHIDSMNAISDRFLHGGST